MKFRICYIKDGKKFEILREAKSLDELKTDDLGVVVRISKAFAFPRFSFEFVDIGSLSVAFLQLSLLLEAGVNISVALDDVANSSNNQNIKKIFTKVHNDVLLGLSLTKSFEKFKSKIGTVSLAFIAMGESSGKLASSLKSLSEVLKNQQISRTKLRKASTYPAIVFIGIIVAFFILCGFIVPQFAQIFSDMGANLPLITRVLLAIYDFVSTYGLFVFLLVFALMFVMLRFYSSNSNFRLSFDKFMLKIFLINKIIKYSSLSLFCFILSELIDSGMPLIDAIKQAANSVKNEYLKQKLDDIGFMICSGVDLKSSFERAEIFDKTSIWLISTSVQTGKFAKALLNVHKYYFDRFNNTSENIQMYIEPFLLLCVGGMVLVLALGVLMPVWDMTSTISF
ncbi:type II secretion system F family protein [Campylobacter sp. 19-13652]|uniref:type II secretion system F family protein n=1 Tax=Campylobacter sp. 19-13652 TaxID=2840180 RepID=UPI001C770F8B|nr:type II secretion system F family protein [Campylobacter sp. 19-13652]BCX80168.1 type II secretion system protein F [Campylobacter sp. 19-13652]